MYIKRGLILIVFLLFVNVANSNVNNFQCEDRTLFGDCNSKGEICAGSNNLIQDNKVSLDAGRYLFFGFIEGDCYLDRYDLYIGNMKIPLSLSGKKRVIAEFVTENYLSGDLIIKCRATGFGGEVKLTKKYLGKVSDTVGLYEDCNICGKCSETRIYAVKCSDGTQIGSCKPGTTLFCGGRNNLIISNPSFEDDTNKDNIPDSYLKDPNAVLNQDVFYSNDAYSGSKSIKITKQWASFDYLIGGRNHIVLSPNTNYLFTALIKGACKNLRVFASTNQVGPAENNLCNDGCLISDASNSWKRLTATFNSNDITTKLPENKGGNPFLAYLRVECADSTPFELYIDNMNLQMITVTPELVENRELCGESTSEQAVNCVIDHDFSRCQALPDNYAAKRIAIEQYAIQFNEPERCTDIYCRQKVGYYNCQNEDKTECIMNAMQQAGIQINPNFGNSEEIYAQFGYAPRSARKRNGLYYGNSEVVLTQFKMQKISRLKVENSCSFVIRQTGGIEYTLPLNMFHGGIVYGLGKNTFGDIIKDKEKFIADTQNAHELIKSAGTDALNRLSEPFWKDDTPCGDNCNMFNSQKDDLKGDLLCGYDDKWYICDKVGIKTFSTGEAFYCDGKVWIPIDEKPAPIVGGGR